MRVDGWMDGYILTGVWRRDRPGAHTDWWRPTHRPRSVPPRLRAYKHRAKS